MRRAALVLAALMAVPAAAEAVRIATFNAALSREGAGVLLAELTGEPRAQIANVAEIVRRVRPDILLVNEFDHDPEARALAAFRDLVAQGSDGVDYPHLFTAPSNTGEPTGRDLDGDGIAAGPKDAYGFGRFPGQYGMGVLSRYPIVAARTFRLFRWADLPGASRPEAPGSVPYHDDETWAALRLSSKSHWDLMVTLPDGRTLHLLASHPTPPVFDGPEDLNGRRNADEIRFWLGHIDGADWIIDDEGQAGGLAPGADFVVLGDLNADPMDGESRAEGIAALLAHPRIQDPVPTSPGGALAPARKDLKGDPARHTADWPESGGPGNLRVDYVLPSDGLTVTGAGVFWPAPNEPLAHLVGRDGRRHASSDHRLVWVDIRLGDAQ